MRAYFLVGMLVLFLVLVLKHSIRSNFKSLSLSLWPIGLFLEKSLLYQFLFKESKTSLVSAENSFNHLRCLQRCLELNGFTAKSTVVPIRLGLSHNFSF